MDSKSENKRTELEELGEFGLIDHLSSAIQLKNETTELGIGDDAAVIDHAGQKTLVSVDLLVEGIHFDLTYIPLKHLGYKSAIVNFSDIYAMNGTPSQIVVGLAVSNRFSVEAVEELYSGLRLACDKYHVDLVGGDTTSSTSGLFISVTVIGHAPAESIAYRNGAKPNELLCVSGDLGAAYAGLLVLEREKSEFKANPNMQPMLEGYDYVLERQLKPEARKDIVAQLAKAGVKPTSMIDISDGLASEILHLCKESNVGCQIYEERLPIAQLTQKVMKEFKMIPGISALNGGEDYELLFTVSQSDYEKIKLMPNISIIGHMTADAGNAVMITGDSHVIPLSAQGWRHF